MNQDASAQPEKPEDGKDDDDCADDIDDAVHGMLLARGLNDRIANLQRFTDGRFHYSPRHPHTPFASALNATVASVAMRHTQRL